MLMHCNIRSRTMWAFGIMLLDGRLRRLTMLIVDRSIPETHIDTFLVVYFSPSAARLADERLSRCAAVWEGRLQFTLPVGDVCVQVVNMPPLSLFFLLFSLCCAFPLPRRYSLLPVWPVMRL